MLLLYWTRRSLYTYIYILRRKIVCTLCRAQGGVEKKARAPEEPRSSIYIYVYVLETLRKYNERLHRILYACFCALFPRCRERERDRKFSARVPHIRGAPVRARACRFKKLPFDTLLTSASLSLLRLYYMLVNGFQ